MKEDLEKSILAALEMQNRDHAATKLALANLISDMPSRQELSSLTQKVDRLETKLDQLTEVAIPDIKTRLALLDRDRNFASALAGIIAGGLVSLGVSLLTQLF